MKRIATLFAALLVLAGGIRAQTCSNTNLGSGMTCVTSKTGTGTTSASVTNSSGYAAGTTIFAFAIGTFGSAFVSGSLSNTAGYSWTFSGSTHIGSNDIAYWYTKVASLNSSSDTISLTKTGGAGYVALNEVVYTGLNAIHGIGANATGTGTSVASGNYTVSTYDLLLGFAFGETLVGGSGWNVRASDIATGGNAPFSAIEDQLAATTTANATFSQTFDPWWVQGLAFTPNSAGGPVISSLNASAYLPSTSITITGFGFGGSQGGSTVTINGTSAGICGTWTATSLVCTVPSGATSGNVAVTVSSVSSNLIPVTIGPVISNVTPIWGTVGASFTVTGQAFGSSQGPSTLQINGMNAGITSWSDTSIVATAPNGSSGNVVVTAASLSSNGVFFRIGTTTPVLPQATVSLTMPTQGGSACPTLTTGSNCIRTPASGSATDLQNAINAATCGDTIVLAAGSTYAGNFSIPSTSCSGWIVIQSSALASLPTSGNRVGPSNVSNMPVLSTANTAPVFNFAPSSNHWRLIGLDITMSYVSTSGGNADNFGLVLIGLTGGSNDITVTNQLPDQIIIDRCIILGLNNTNLVRGVLLNTQSSAVVDSYCDEVHANDRDSQCLNVYNGTGPYLFQNNFLRASGENIMFGGSDPAIANLTPSDITIIGNDIEKNVSWRSNASPTNWTVKNLFETKNIQRFLIDGNVLQTTWNNQQNEAVIIRSDNQSGGCTWCASADGTFTHNFVQHAGNAMDIDPEDGTFPALATQRILVQNNIFNDISGATWGAGAGDGGIYVMNAISSFMPTMHDIFFDHNDSFQDGPFSYLGDTGTLSNVRYTNNLGDYGSTGFQGTGQTSGDAVGILNAFISPYTWSQNVFATTSKGTWPSGTIFSTNLAGIGFTSVTGTDPNLSGNFQLTSGSAYHNAGTDGRDIGVWDWTCFNSTTGAALAGNYSASTVGSCYPAAPSPQIQPAPGSVLFVWNGGHD